MEKEGTSAGIPPDYAPRERERHTMEPPQRNTADTDSDFQSISPEDRPPQAFEGKDEECRHSSSSGTNRDTAVVVPRPNRRGLFGQFTLLAEVENPKTYSRKKKWFITFIVAWAGATAPMGSAILFPALSQVTKELSSTTTVANLNISLYMLSMSIFPLWWSSFSERLGRRTIYLASFCLFVVFNVLCAISKSMAMLIVMRMLSGGASASVQAVGAGTIADLWESQERGRAMGIFYLGPLCGPLVAPIVGGALAQRWKWRSTLWFLAAYGGITVAFIFLALPETLISAKSPSPNTSSEQQEPIGRRLSRVSSRQVVGFTTKWLKVLKMALIDPLKIVLYLRYPPVLLTVYYASITFGSLYVLNVSVEHTFGSDPYNFTTILVGLLYIPNSLGYVVASTFGGRWMDNIMQREAKKAQRYDENGNLIYHPEDRMRENAWLGALLYPAALIWYGWTADRGVFWLAPMIANFFFGIGSMLIFSMATTMLTEFMPKKASSGVALNNFMRNIFSCVGSLVTAPIIDAIGNGWLFTILGIVAFLSSSVLFAMKVFGPRWRKSMDALRH
ncbi:major facilitator superfamily domain-containing protein [Aspergillus pseudonomiae]|uniref:Major facilitator superfamily domain-containing protein n=1 Tax=Aspergillus pseudonomiae TaxID=1506151 RepID=A0A5N7DQB5_9EURO|nr:major facilitator superfamily domain-containing protein [Aspergillus pseudonomiae]KAB8260130.1 major facilitator superfamily domain-containing protein [Aspergillus pseudonomiae]KAE8408233.1 major facilitator superfamily domain-containing protein [Aspergillus pseudonomiae]